MRFVDGREGESSAESKAWPWWLALAALLAVTAWVYAPVAGYPFVNYDDPDYVLENPQVQAGLTVASARWALTTGHASNWHPVTWWSHMADQELGGSDPGAHHRSNLGLHLLNTLLTALVLAWATGRRWLSLAVAALFALHPTHVESVAWISERKDLLSAFFFWLTVAAYIAWVRRPAISSGFGRYVLVIVALGLGLASKPMLVTLPFVLLLLDIWPLARETREGEHPGANWWRARVVEKLPLFVLAAVSSAVTLGVQRAGGAVSSLQGLPLAERIANAVLAYGTYLGKLVWPSHLAVLYPLPEERSWAAVLAVALLLAAVTWGTLLVSRRSPGLQCLAVGWLWFLGTLVPVIGLVQVGVQAMADRYTYLPYTGLFLMVAFGVRELLRSRAAAVTAGAALVLVAGIFGLLTNRQVAHWRSSTALFEHSLEVTGPNPHLENLLGITLVSGKTLESTRKGTSDRERIEAGRSHLAEAVRLKPDFTTAHNNLGVAAQRLGLPAQAEGHFRDALGHLDPGGREAAEVFNNLGNVLAEQGRLEAAVEAYRRAQQADPTYAAALRNLGLSLAEAGRLGEARQALEAAVALAPEPASAAPSEGPRLDLARVLVAEGSLEAAEAQYREIQGLEARRDLADLLALQGRFREAAQEYRAVVSQRPSDAAARFLLAVAALEMGDRSTVQAQAEALESLGGELADTRARQLRQLLAGAPGPSPIRDESPQ